MPRPGGKTAHLLELADADVLATDIDARCERIPRQPAPPGRAARVLAADAARQPTGSIMKPF